MNTITISEDTILDHVSTGDLVITSGATVKLIGTLYGNVDVGKGCHFQLNGIMKGDLTVSGGSTAEIRGSLFADQILDSGTLVIYGNVTSNVGPYHAKMEKGSFMNMMVY